MLSEGKKYRVININSTSALNKPEGLDDDDYGLNYDIAVVVRAESGESPITLVKLSCVSHRLILPTDISHIRADFSCGYFAQRRLLHDNGDTFPRT